MSSILKKVAAGVGGLAAIGGGGLGAVYGAYKYNQLRQDNKGARGYIDRAYRSASDRMEVLQGDTRQAAAEAMNARGMGGSASAVRAAMVNGKPVSLGAAPTDLASQSQTDLGKEFALERNDLDEAHSRAVNETKADYQNSLIGAVANAGKTAMTASTGAGELAALSSLGSAAPSAARQAYTSGIDNPANVWGGVHPIDPLNAPGSSWNRKTTTVGAGQANYDFNSGNG